MICRALALLFCAVVIANSTFSQTKTGVSFVSTNQSSYTDSAASYYQKGLQEKQLGRRAESLKYFEKAAQENPNNPAVMAELGAAYMDLRKYSMAKKAYQKLEALGTPTAADYKQLMELSYQLKQFDDAVYYANLYRRADPKAKVSFSLGKIHYMHDNYGEALKYLNAALKEEPQNAEAPYMIARSYADMMNYKQSVPYFIKAIELDSTKLMWMYELGLVFYAMHDDKNALKFIQLAGDKGLEKDNDYIENLGIAYLNAGNLEEGAKVLTEVLKRKPSDLNILNILAESYYYKGKYDVAIDYWDKILSYDKQSASALYMIGMSYQKKGEKEKGMQLCDKAIQMDPSLAHLKQKKMTLAGL